MILKKHRTIDSTLVVRQEAIYWTSRILTSINVLMVGSWASSFPFSLRRAFSFSFIVGRFFETVCTTPASLHEGHRRELTAGEWEHPIRISSKTWSKCAGSVKDIAGFEQILRRIFIWPSTIKHLPHVSFSCPRIGAHGLKSECSPQNMTNCA